MPQSCYREPAYHLPQVQSTDNNKRDQKVDDSGGHHHVKASRILLIKWNTAPSRLHKNVLLVHQVVHLGEEGPGHGRQEADQPDHTNHLPCLASGRPGEGRHGAADGQVPAQMG